MLRRPALRLPLPATLLLGLLALLLWGQCALLFPGVATPPPALEGRVSSTDSLRMAPSTLFLTLHLQNTIQEPVMVQEVSGSLRFGTRTFPFPPPAALRGRRLLVFEELTQVVAIPLALRPDSLLLLRRLLSGPNERSGQAYLRWEVRYTRPGTRAAYSLGRTVPYLPSLTQ